MEKFITAVSPLVKENRKKTFIKICKALVQGKHLLLKHYIIIFMYFDNNLRFVCAKKKNFLLQRNDIYLWNNMIDKELKKWYNLLLEQKREYQ